MKKLMWALASAAMLALPTVSQAQVDPSVNLFLSLDQTYRIGGAGYNGDGGGFLGTFTVDFPSGPQTFTDYLVWCIDNGRNVSTGSSTNYALYSLAQFAAGPFASSSTGHDPDAGDMNRIASLVTDLAALGTSNANQRFLLQGSIWSEFDGYTTYGGNNALGNILTSNTQFNAGNAYVFWNGQNQTFLTFIPEPGSLALLLVGLSGFAAVVARRRNA